MLKLSASAIVVTAGLLLASAIMAAQAARSEPNAQMNRALYAARSAAPSMSLPVHRPAAQMNRALYAPRPTAQPAGAASPAQPLVPAPLAQMSRALYRH